MVDDREQRFDEKNLSLVQKLCDRKFGIGADGLILIRNHADFDFEMIYFNADGSQSMCGNGARCAVAFCYFLGFIKEKTHILAIFGPQDAIFVGVQVELLIGNFTVNLLPLLTSLSTRISPSWAATNALTIANPKPVPVLPRSPRCMV